MESLNLSPNAIITIIFLAMLAIGWTRGGLADLRWILSLTLGLIAIPIFYIPCSNLLLSTGIFGQITNGLPSTIQGVLTSWMLKTSTFILITFITRFIINIILPLEIKSLGVLDNCLGVIIAFIKICFLCWLLHFICTTFHIQTLSDINTWLMKSWIYEKLSSINYLDYIKNLR